MLAGITSVALVAHESQPMSEEDTVPLQTMMFTLAGALQGTDVKLEIRRPDDLMERGLLQFLPGLWNAESTQALVPHLRVFEVGCGAKDDVLRSGICVVH